MAGAIQREQFSFLHIFPQDIPMLAFVIRPSCKVFRRHPGSVLYFIVSCRSPPGAAPSARPSSRPQDADRGQPDPSGNSGRHPAGRVTPEATARATTHARNRSVRRAGAPHRGAEAAPRCHAARPGPIPLFTKRGRHRDTAMTDPAPFHASRHCKARLPLPVIARSSIFPPSSRGAKRRSDLVVVRPSRRASRGVASSACGLLATTRG